jgi:hypothetical protein
LKYFDFAKEAFKKNMLKRKEVTLRNPDTQSRLSKTLIIQLKITITISSKRRQDLPIHLRINKINRYYWVCLEEEINIQMDRHTGALPSIKGLYHEFG